MRFEVDQRGVDTRAVVFDPAGEAFPAVDGFTGSRGIDEGVAVAAGAGEHHLEISWSGRFEQSAAYRLSARIRPATEEDRVAVAAQSSYRRGRELRDEDDPESEALEAFRDAVELYRQAGLSRGEAWAQHALGELHKKLGERAAAEPAFVEAVRLYGENGERYGAVRAGIDLARVRRQLGDLAGARRSAEQVAALAAEIEAEVWLRKARAELGHVAADEGRAAEAVRIYSSLLGEGEAGLTRQELYDLQNAFGTLYLDAGEPAAAAARFEAALAAVSDEEERAQVLQNLGRAHRESGAWEEAIEDLQEARTIFEAEGDHQNVAETLNILGLAHLERGDEEEAGRMLDAALIQVRDHQLGSYEASVQVNLARHALAVGDREKAHDRCLRAHAVADETGRADLRASAGYCVARSLLELGRLTEALEATAEYLALAESLRADKAHAGHRAGYQARKRHFFELPVTLHLRLAEREGAGHADAAFAAAERARFRVLHEMLAAAGADLRSGLEPDHRRELEAAEGEITRLAAESPREEDPEERERLEDELDRARASFLRLEEESRRSHPAYAELTAPEPVSLDVVRSEVLDGETQLLVYFLGEQESWVWLVDRDEVSVHELPPAAEIGAQAEKVARQLAVSGDKRSRGVAAMSARTLAETILAPVASRLRGPRLAIVADGKLHAVPFGALSLPAADGAEDPDRPRLVERFEIVYPASVSVLRAQRRMRRERGPAPSGIAILGDPVFTADDERFGTAARRPNGRPPSGRPLAATGTALGPTATRSSDTARICADLRRLPYSGDEAVAIAELAPEAELRTGFEARRQWVLGRGLEGFGRLHFATHACVDTERPELSGIALSMLDPQGREVEGMLRAHEIYGLRLSADLAVVSACSSALGREVRGEGLLGITRGFLYAGVPRVVVSLWDVDDEATAELMQRFYRGLYERGETPSAALTAAQREMARSERWSAPEQWAAFVVQGDWR